MESTAIHCIGKGRFHHGYHTEVVQAALIGGQPAGDLAQGVFAGDLGAEAGQKLPPRGKMFAAAAPGCLVGFFVETISGDELEKLLKDAMLNFYDSLVRHKVNGKKHRKY